MTTVSYNYLGASGIKVSNICLGTMLFGDHPQGRPSCPEVEAHKVLDRFAELGGNFIDTADVYHTGQSEEIIGRWLTKKDRRRFVIATKCSRIMDSTDPNCAGASRRHMMWSVEQSLKRLQTDYIDVYYLHCWDNGTPIEETLAAMNELVQKGKVRYLAVCNVKGWQLQKIVELSKWKNLEPIVCLQQQYSLLCRSPEWETLEVCQNEGLALLPWSPLKGGWLSGKIKKGSSKPAEGTRVAWSQDVKGRAQHSHPDFDWFASNGHAFEVLDKVDQIANKEGKSVAQVSLRWLLQKPNVSSVVIGPRTLEHLEDSMAATSWSLTSEEMAELDLVSEIPAPYPYDYIQLANIDRERRK